MALRRTLSLISYFLSRFCFRSLGKKLSGLLHTGDENDWSDLGLESLDSSGGGNGGGGNGGQHSNGGSSSNGGTPHISRDGYQLF